MKHSVFTREDFLQYERSRELRTICLNAALLVETFLFREEPPKGSLPLLLHLRAELIKHGIELNMHVESYGGIGTHPVWWAEYLAGQLLATTEVLPATQGTLAGVFQYFDLRDEERCAISERLPSMLAKAVEYQAPPGASFTRTFAEIDHAGVVAVYDAYVEELGQVPNLLIRGVIECVVPGKRPGSWRKTRETSLLKWQKVEDWKRNEPLMLITYHWTSRFSDQVSTTWVHPDRTSHRWAYVRLEPPLDRGDPKRQTPLLKSSGHPWCFV